MSLEQRITDNFELVNLMMSEVDGKLWYVGCTATHGMGEEIARPVKGEHFIYWEGSSL